MEEFLEKIIKIELYVDVVMTRLNKATYYNDSDSDIKALVRKDLVSIINRDLYTLQMKEAVLKAYDQCVDDDEYSAILLTIKRKLFKRCKEIGMITLSDNKLIK